MSDNVKLRLKPEDFANHQKIKDLLSKAVGKNIYDFRIIRKSIDARQRQIWIDADFSIVESGDIEKNQPISEIKFHKLSDESPQVIIVGAGPAGLFAAIKALESGWRPIIIERGKPVEERIKDIASLQKEKDLNPESNFCFGEGGAGAFSDGKLFTRSKKRGNIKEVLEILVKFGAKPEILYESHPHIGSDRLPKIIRAIRDAIKENGGEIYFSTKFEKLIINDKKVKGIITNTGKKFWGPVILATGHSAHDVYDYLHSEGISLQQKGFAMGVRLEHPQSLIDRMVYHNKDGRGKYLPPAEYKMACQVDGRGVYSFCMCPGGVIVPSPSAPGESVVNGMSASARSGKWANSGIVVEIRPEDFPEYQERGDLGMLYLQKETERSFYNESHSINAPAQRMKDFVDGVKSKDLPPSSYVPGIHPADMNQLLPPFIARKLKEGLKIFGKKNKGFLTNEAILIGLESRTSSPVRIPRDPESMAHPSFPGLYPVGEGAGYSGGIVSSAVDGIRAMDTIVKENNQL